MLVDPTRILVSRDVGMEMLAVYSRQEYFTKDDKSMTALNVFYGNKSTMPYYEVLGFLILLEICRDNQINHLRTLFKPEEKQDWDYNIGFGKDDKSKRATKQQGSPQGVNDDQSQQLGDADEEGNQKISSFNRTGIQPTGRDQMSEGVQGDQDVDDYRLRSPDLRDGARPNRENSDQKSQLNTRTVTSVSRQEAPTDKFRRQGLAGPGYQDRNPGYSQTDNDLNSLLRKRMTALISKFLDAVIDEDHKIENKAQTKLKMNSIVNRKCQNLLSAVFAGEKQKFQKLLMMKIESTKDAIAVDNTFDRYETLKGEGLENANDKLINDYLKNMLKVAYNLQDRSSGQPYQQSDNVHHDPT